MPEIDMRNNPWNPGIPMDPVTIARDLYMLLAIFSASKEICGRRTDESDEGSVYGYSIRGFELPEVGRLLVSLAASCRNDWDSRLTSIDDARKTRGKRKADGVRKAIDDALKACGKSPEVGVLTKDFIKQPHATTALLVYESWNKILHCHDMNFHRSEGPSIYSGHLQPHVHLYGEWDDKNWKASIDIYRWCEVVHVLT